MPERRGAGHWPCGRTLLSRELCSAFVRMAAVREGRTGARGLAQSALAAAGARARHALVGGARAPLSLCYSKFF